jgi:hypothetical protein
MGPLQSEISPKFVPQLKEKPTVWPESSPLQKKYNSVCYARLHSNLLTEQFEQFLFKFFDTQRERRTNKISDN